MKIKVEDLVFSLSKLTELSKVDLPVKLGYRVSKNIKKIKDEVITVQEKQIELIKKRGAVSDEKTGGWSIVPPKQPEAKATKKGLDEYNKLLDEHKANIKGYQEDEKQILSEEIDVDIMTFPLSMFTDDIRVSPDILVGLDYMITED